MRIAVTQSCEAVPSLQAATALLGVQERIIRRAAGCDSRAGALMGIAGELSRLLPIEYCWLEHTGHGGRATIVTVVTPQDDNTWRLLGEAGTADERELPAENGPPVVTIHSEWTPSDAGHETFSALGVAQCVKVSYLYESGDRGAVVLGFAETVTPEVADVLQLLAPCIAAAMRSPSEAPADPAPRHMGAMDTVELVDYVARALAHDVRNIMSGIIGAIELQRASTDAANVPIFDVVRRRAVEGVAMVDAMRERLTRLSAGPQVPVDMAVVAAEVVTSVEATLAATYGADAPHITVEAERAMVQCVPSELRRAAVALLFNAVRAAGPGGSVVVRTWVDRRHSVMQFTDSGTGLPEDHCRRAKEPFYTTEEAGHPGLGLTIADGVARSSGGSVSARIAETGGMTAALMLPAADIGDLPV